MDCYPQLKQAYASYSQVYAHYPHKTYAQNTCFELDLWITPENQLNIRQKLMQDFFSNM
jgi:ABC-type sugar transport system ATPase subunit